MTDDPFDNPELAIAVVQLGFARKRKLLEQELAKLRLPLAAAENPPLYEHWLSHTAGKADLDRSLPLIIFASFLLNAQRSFLAGHWLKSLAHAMALLQEPHSVGLRLRATGGRPRKLDSVMEELARLVAQEAWERHPRWSKSQIAGRLVEALGGSATPISKPTAMRILKGLKAPSRR